MDLLPERKYWVYHVIKKNISGFINELRDDLKKFYDYCPMSLLIFDNRFELNGENSNRTNYRNKHTTGRKDF